MKEELLKKLRPITAEEQEILNGRTRIDSALYNLNKSMVVDSKKLLEHGKLIELRPHTRFIHFPRHTHNYVEIVYMCSGSTTHLINGTQVTLRTGEMLFLSRNAAQEILPAGQDDIAVNLIILPEFFDQSLTMLENQDNLLHDFLVECLRSNSQDIHYLHFKAAHILPVQNLMENLIWMLLHKQPNKRSMNQTTMSLLFLHLMNFTDNVDVGKNHAEQELTFTVLSYIEEHYRGGELSALAQRLGCSLYWLSRIIRQTTGKTYTELVQEKRLMQAAYLLRNTTLSITDISLDIGYNNFSYFYRIFKKRFGMTPRDYRILS